MSPQERQDEASSPEVGERRRRPKHRKAVHQRPKAKGRWIVLLFVLLLTGGLVYHEMYRTAHFVVMLNDTPLVALATEEQAANLIRGIKLHYAKNDPRVVTFAQGDLTIEPLHRSSRLTDLAEAERILKHRLTVVLKGYAIVVDGKPLALLATKADAIKALALMLEAGKAEDAEGIPSFAQRITVGEYTQKPDDEHAVPVMTAWQTARELTHPPRPQFYTVERGDSFYAIGQKRGLTVQQIKALNPSLDPGALQPGDQVRLPDILAPVRVVVRK